MGKEAGQADGLIEDAAGAGQVWELGRARSGSPGLGAQAWHDHPCCLKQEGFRGAARAHGVQCPALFPTKLPMPSVLPSQPFCSNAPA